MNIFVLDDNPSLAAAYHCDKHVVKMALESAQLLSTATILSGGQAPYKPTHINHPCAVWARASRENFLWLLEHHAALLAEYQNRYQRQHASAKLFKHWLRGSWDIPNRQGLTPFAQAMPEELRITNDPVTAYRNFYRRDKASFAKWAYSKQPLWW